MTELGSSCDKGDEGEHGKKRGGKKEKGREREGDKENPGRCGKREEVQKAEVTEEGREGEARGSPSLMRGRGYPPPRPPLSSQPATVLSVTWKDVDTGIPQAGLVV